ncbi:MAG: hypothetical protein LBK62_01305 [Treponema sp.]|jgi:hypothetical protein|nr:hypothetical protein [Treponema sp.]
MAETRGSILSGNVYRRERLEPEDKGMTVDSWLIERHPAWKPIRSIGVVESSREVNGNVTVERRYFVSSDST